MTRSIHLLVVISLVVLAFVVRNPRAAEGISSCRDDSDFAATPSAATPIAPSAAGTLETVADVPLSGGADRFDYQSFDSASGLLYIAHMGSGQLIVFDVASRSIVTTIDGVPGITGVLAVPELHAIYASVSGSHEVVAIDDESLEIIAHIGSIEFPDGLDYSPETKQLFVSDEHGGGELVIDAEANTVVTTIDIGGEAGNTHYDPATGCIVVAAQRTGELLTIDPRSNEVRDRIDLGGGCRAPHGFLIDSIRRLAYVTCETNAALLTVDLSASTITGTTTVGESPDVLALDAGFHRLYVAAESGSVSVFSTSGEKLEIVEQFQTPYAHSVAVDPATHLVYFPLENIDGKPVLRIMSPGQAG